MPINLYHISEKDAGQDIDLFLFEHHWVHHRSSLMTDYAGLRPRVFNCCWCIRMGIGGEKAGQTMYLDCTQQTVSPRA